MQTLFSTFRVSERKVGTAEPRFAAFNEKFVKISQLLIGRSNIFQTELCLCCVFMKAEFAVAEGAPLKTHSRPAKVLIVILIRTNTVIDNVVKLAFFFFLQGKSEGGINSAQIAMTRQDMNIDVLLDLTEAIRSRHRASLDCSNNSIFVIKDTVIHRHALLNIRHLKH